MKPTGIVLGLIALTSAAVYAAPEMPKDEYQDWKNKPAEKFSDAEANFNAAKKLLMEHYFDSKLTQEKLYEAATRGMLAALNPNPEEDWNKLFSPSEFREFQTDLKGEVTGVGIEIKFNEESGSASVVHVIKGSAADSAGVKDGDLIVSINGKISKGLQFRDLVYSIRGKVGESVKLKLLRGDEIITKKITREKINWSAVETSELPGKVALVKIHFFNEKSSELLKSALEKANANHSSAIIVDLRDDEGGLFDQAVEAAQLFTPKGKTVVRVESRDGSEKIYSATSEPLIKNTPVILLVSEKTSSGAELFAGALSENIGAKLVGAKTHGKWSVQTLETLPNGYAIKFTMKIFKTPSGKSYSGLGIAPDVSVIGSKEIPSLKQTQNLLEKDAALKTAYELVSTAH